MRLFNYQHALDFISESEVKLIESEVLSSKEKLIRKTGLGNDFLGWVDYPEIVEVELERINKLAKRIRQNSEVLLVIGIGGSYLGAKAGLEMLLPYRHQGSLEIIFVGNTLSSAYTKTLLDYLENKDFSINVISKSGTTTEPAIAFRLFRRLLSKKYASLSKQRIYVTTTLGKGALYQLAKEKDYEILSIPEDIGGRYSVLTPVGLLPMAAAGIDILAMIEGAQAERLNCIKRDYLENDALLYAALRNLLYKKGMQIEILATYEPKLKYFGEWYKQLFGESEGKDKQGLFPVSVIYTTDLHSLGQYVQDGKRIIFETTLNIENPSVDINLEAEENNFDELNYLAGLSLDQVNKQAMKGTILAHVEGGVPNLLINLPEISAYQFGRLVYFFMFACGVSGYLLGINPFNQEGVEAYKRNMFALLGKPGYDSLRKALEKKS